MPIVQYKCPNCGGNLEFKADKQKFCCEYCLSDFTEAQIKDIFERNESTNLNENVDEAYESSEEFNAHTNLYTCPSCAAEIITDDTTSASFCYYCHNPVILSGRLSGDYKPSNVLPFKLDDKKAKDIFKQWCGKRWFLPSEFKSQQQLEKMSGVYVPFWIADCKVDAHMNAIGKHIRSWSSGNYRYTETKEYSLVRTADIKFNGVPADGASKIEDKLMEAIEPFDYKEIKPFSMSYLSGFMANKYDVDKAGVFPVIKNRVVGGSEKMLRDSMCGYSSVTVTNSNINVLKTDWKYMLLPVWFMTYKYNGKVYSFAVNGQTGKLAGTPPLSVPKLLGFCGGLFGALTLILTLGGYLFR